MPGRCVGTLMLWLASPLASVRPRNKIANGRSSPSSSVPSGPRAIDVEPAVGPMARAAGALASPWTANVTVVSAGMGPGPFVTVSVAQDCADAKPASRLAASREMQGTRMDYSVGGRGHCREGTVAGTLGQ